MKPTILVMCVGNSCRSQIAAGWLRHLGGDRVEILGGGAKPAKSVARRAIAVMDEVGMDLRGQVPTFYQDHFARPIDHAVAVCHETECTYTGFADSTIFHRLAVDDPGHHEGTEDEILEAHRRVREELRAKMTSFLAAIGA